MRRANRNSYAQAGKTPILKFQPNPRPTGNAGKVLRPSSRSFPLYGLLGGKDRESFPLFPAFSR